MSERDQICRYTSLFSPTWIETLNLTLSRMSMDLLRTCDSTFNLSPEIMVISGVKGSGRSIKAMRRSVFCPCICQRWGDLCWRCSAGRMGLKRWSRTSWLSVVCLRYHDCFQLSHFLLWIVTLLFPVLSNDLIPTCCKGEDFVQEDPQACSLWRSYLPGIAGMTSSVFLRSVQKTIKVEFRYINQNC